MNKTIITNSAQETKELGASIAQAVKAGSVICLIGDLGAGKTTFTQGFAVVFGINKIISPTFIIQRSYEFTEKNGVNVLHHLDLYRMQEATQVDAIGLKDLINDSKSVVLIEWPEKIIKTLPDNRTEIYFHSLGEDKRKIQIMQKNEN